MNYIILSDKVKETLEVKYNSYVRDFQYILHFDAYVLDMISFNNVIRLYNRKWKSENGEEYKYGLIGKKCILFAMRHRYCQDCFYITNIKFFEKEEEFCSKLAQTVELPGTWKIKSYLVHSNLEEIEDISDLLDSLHGSYGEMEEYSKQWGIWDRYNAIQRKNEEEIEEKSLADIESTVVDGSEFRIVLKTWNSAYAIGKCVAVLEKDKLQYTKLGIITKINESLCELYVTCEEMIIEQYFNNEIGRFTTIKLVDYGKLSKLRRQKETLKRLFQKETTNPNLRDIVDGSFLYACQEFDLPALKTNLNIKQNTAYFGALNTDDIFLIQGPPGTGKTTIISELVKTLVSKGMSILISSETHIAVDNVLERVKHIDKILPLRLGREEKISKENLEYIPENIAKSALEKCRKEQEILRNKGYDINALILEKKEKLDELIQKFERVKKQYEERLPECVAIEALVEDISKFEYLLTRYNEQYMAYQKTTEVQTASVLGIKHAKKRMESIKNKIVEQLEVGDLFLVTIHKIKENYDAILKINRQINQSEIEFEHEKDELEKDIAYKKMLLTKSKDIREEWEQILQRREIQEEIENIYINNANVIFSTCSGIGSNANNNFFLKEYDYVIVDEAAKCNMLDLLMPLSLGKRIILVGDHKQLYPMLEQVENDGEITQEEMTLLKEHILFKYLYETNVPEQYKQMLSVQYRMPYDISEYISHNFYKAGLECAKENNHADTMVMIDCETSREEKIGTSYQNVEEAKIVVRLLEKLEHQYQEMTSVGIICMYKRQAVLIDEMLQEYSYEHIDVECSTVDAFQGKEKHTIILNTVRSEKASSFFRDENRINVAVSRTMERLYVVGSARLLRNNESGKFSELYSYISSCGKVYNSNYVRR